MRTLILSTFLYAFESWTLTAEIERIQALEMRCYRRLLNISYKDHVMNKEVRNRIQNAIGVHDDLLTMVKKWKLRWYGLISRSSGMAKTILQGTLKGARRRGRQKKRWEDNIKEWTGMGFGDSLRAAEDREGWKGIVATSSVVSRRPPRLRDWDEMRWLPLTVFLGLSLSILHIRGHSFKKTKEFIFGQWETWRICFHSISSGSRVALGHFKKVWYFVFFYANPFWRH